MSDCVICKIVSGSVPAWVAHRTSCIICFLAKEPETYGHTIIAPIDHYPDIYSGTVESIGALMAAARSLAFHYRERIGASGVNLLHASGSAAQQSVGHMHLHLLPRFDSDGIDAWPALPGTEMNQHEFLEVVGQGEPGGLHADFPEPSANSIIVKQSGTSRVYP
jgi:histidine triad (HIT) family protein